MADKIDACINEQGILGFMRSFYKFYLRSSDETTLNFAERICKRTKGHIAMFDREDKRSILRKILIRQFQKPTGGKFKLRSLSILNGMAIPLQSYIAIPLLLYCYCIAIVLLYHCNYTITVRV